MPRTGREDLLISAVCRTVFREVERKEAGSQKGHYSLSIFKKQKKNKVSEKRKDERITKGFRFSSSKDPPNVRRKAGELFSESAEKKKDECRGKDSLMWSNEDKDVSY